MPNNTPPKRSRHKPPLAFDRPGRMSAQRAEEIARDMIRQNVSAYAGKWRVALVLNVRIEDLSESATRKVLRAFRQRVLSSARYTVMDKMHAEEKLAEEVAEDLLQ